MNKLITTNNLTMSSLEIAELTNKRHDHVLRDINNTLETLGAEAPNFGAFSRNVSQEGKTINYTMDKKAVLLLVSGYNVKLRGNIINRIEELENQQKPKTPQTYLEALEELVAVTKEKERLQSLNNALMHVQKTYTTSELAKELGFKSAKLLNQKLHQKGIQYKQNDTWLLYSKYADMDLVEQKQGSTNTGHVYYNSQWKQKGRQFVLALFGLE